MKNVKTFLFPSCADELVFHDPSAPRHCRLHTHRHSVLACQHEAPSVRPDLTELGKLQRSIFFTLLLRAPQSEPVDLHWGTAQPSPTGQP